MKTKNLREVLQLISENYENEKISKDELASIAKFCMGIDEMKSINLIKLDINSIVAEINKITAKEMSDLFTNDKNLNQYNNGRQLLSKTDIQNGINSGQLFIYFSDVNGKLELSLNPNPNFKNSPIKAMFDKYGIYKIDQNCADYITIPKADLEKVIKLSSGNNATITIEPAISTSCNRNKTGRVTVILTCEVLNKFEVFFDTFQLSPP